MDLQRAPETGTEEDLRTQEAPEPPAAQQQAPEAQAEERGAEERPLGSRAPWVIRRSRPLHVSWQVGVFLVGLAVVAAGVAMLVLPGPGWVVIFAGMAIWATEFVWAQIVMRWTKRKLRDGNGRFKRWRAERAARKSSGAPADMG